MRIDKPGTTPSAEGPAAYFTGRVRIDCPFYGSGNLSAGTVTFEPASCRAIGAGRATRATASSRGARSPRCWCAA